MADFERSDLRSLDQPHLKKLQRDLEGRVAQAGERASEHLRGLRDQMQSVVEAVREQISINDVTAAVEEKSEAYREATGCLSRWAQVGTALGVIQHEFISTVNSIRKSIQELKPWADGTPALNTAYRSAAYRLSSTWRIPCAVHSPEEATVSQTSTAIGGGGATVFKRNLRSPFRSPWNCLESDSSV